MADWTNPAKAEFDRYFHRVGASLAGTGADAAEVIDDLKRHVESEIERTGLKIVTEEDMRRILGRIGEPDVPRSVETPAAAETAPPPGQPKRRKSPGFTLLIFGFFLPVLTFLVELQTRMCAEVLFDPMPTIWHELMVAFVPLSNLALWIGLRKEKTEWRSKLLLANGFALGVCIYYTLLFIVFTPFALIGLIYFGFGLLPLTPLIALITTSILSAGLWRLKTEETERFWQKRWPALVGALAILLILDLPAPLTRYFERAAVSDDRAVAAQGVQRLRRFGSKNTLLEDCYEDSRPDMPEFSISGPPVKPEDARNLYFRVTGQPFNSVPAFNISAFSRNPAYFDEWSWDPGLGGDVVAERVKGLSLKSSRLDVRVETDAALTYCEWTLEFKNDAPMEREARAQILLPPGGVVSRLTLWVNGEEREAAFGSRSQTRQAYQDVAIVKRRDPVLVTTCGPDRVLMQCYPVPANGGTMKVRIGVTAPLALENPNSGRFRWPVFLEENFAAAAGLKHSVWIESKEPLKSGLKSLKEDRPASGQFVLRGDLTDPELNDPEASSVAKRSAGLNEVWSAGENGDQVITQKIVGKPELPPSRVILVVDGSVGMTEFVPAIANALRHLPAGLDFAATLASDTTVMLSGAVQKGNDRVYESAARQLQKSPFVGGQDNVPALMQAWDLAAEGTNSVVLWIHGAQPEILDSLDGLQQRRERSPHGPQLLEIQTKAGPDRVTEKLDGFSAVSSVARFGKLEDDLDGVFAQWNGKSTLFGFERDIAEAGAVKSSPSIKKASPNVARLWAASQVLQLAAARHYPQASDLAVRSHIVTPYSGAVVLETAAEFAREGLTPVDPEKVPTMTLTGSTPDTPETFALLLMALVLLFGFARLRGTSPAETRR